MPRPLAGAYRPKVLQDVHGHNLVNPRDQAARELARNEADQLTYAVEKTMHDLGDKLADGERNNIQAIITELNSVKNSDDTAKIKEVTERLQQASHALTQQAYQTEQGQGQSGQGNPDDEGVIEGDFQEM